MKNTNALTLWYAADLLAILAILALGVLGAVTGRGLSPDAAGAGILAVLAGRLTPRGPGSPPSAGLAPTRRRRGPSRLAASHGAIASAVFGLAALLRRLWPQQSPRDPLSTLHPV